jgi:hypothetical protein
MQSTVGFKIVQEKIRLIQGIFQKVILIVTIFVYEIVLMASVRGREPTPTLPAVRPIGRTPARGKRASRE